MNKSKCCKKFNVNVRGALNQGTVVPAHTQFFGFYVHRYVQVLRAASTGP